MTSQTSANLLRSVIRRILLEAAGPEKSSQLVDKLVQINSFLETRGIDAQVGILVDYSSGGSLRISFALGSRSHPDAIEKKRLLSAESTDLSEIVSEIQSVSADFVGVPDRDLDSQVEKSLVRAKSSEALREVPMGSIRIYPVSDYKDLGPCKGAWVVQMVSPTSSGWGPLLYDIALEWSTKEGGVGLVSDRESVSGEARKVWGVYGDPEKRRDVTPTQLDIFANIEGIPDSAAAKSLAGEPTDPGYEDRVRAMQITPDDLTDDCVQDSAYAQNPGSWRESPLSRAYSKELVIIPNLSSKKLLWDLS
jgi:hypothetical protein